MHFELLKKLLTACREKGYHTALETNGLISAAHLKELIPLTDLFCSILSTATPMPSKMGRRAACADPRVPGSP